jgi:hypothetical protein
VEKGGRQERLSASVPNCEILCEHLFKRLRTVGSNRRKQSIIHIFPGWVMGWMIEYAVDSFQIPSANHLKKWRADSRGFWLSVKSCNKCRRWTKDTVEIDIEIRVFEEPIDDWPGEAGDPSRQCPPA